MEQKVKNMMVSCGCENILVYCLTLTAREIGKYFQKVISVPLVDIVECRDDELQFYIIDGRVWLDTPEKEKRVREVIA